LSGRFAEAKLELEVAEGGALLLACGEVFLPLFEEERRPIIGLVG
jgi:hypothetical protein